MSMMYQELGSLTWRKSSYSAAGNCIEVASGSDSVRVRDAIAVANSVICRNSVMDWVTTVGWNQDDSLSVPVDEDADEPSILVSASA